MYNMYCVWHPCGKIFLIGYSSRMGWFKKEKKGKWMPMCSRGVDYQGTRTNSICMYFLCIWSLFNCERRFVFLKNSLSASSIPFPPLLPLYSWALWDMDSLSLSRSVIYHLICWHSLCHSELFTPRFIQLKNVSLKLKRKKSINWISRKWG